MSSKLFNAIGTGHLKGEKSLRRTATQKAHWKGLRGAFCEGIIFATNVERSPRRSIVSFLSAQGGRTPLKFSHREKNMFHEVKPKIIIQHYHEDRLLASRIKVNIIYIMGQSSINKQGGSSAFALRHLEQNDITALLVLTYLPTRTSSSWTCA